MTIMDNQNYISMCKKILNNTEWYKNISVLSIGQYNANFYKMVDQSYNNGAITKDLYDFVRTKHPKVVTFYNLPKIHKDPKNLPGCPIVSVNGAISENLSRVIDAYLQPYVLSLPSFVKDTIQFLQIIEELNIPGDFILVAIDCIPTNWVWQLYRESCKRACDTIAP